MLFLSLPIILMIFLLPCFLAQFKYRLQGAKIQETYARKLQAAYGKFCDPFLHFFLFFNTINL